MNVWLNSDGTRNREFRPYIEQENQANSVYLYDPEGPGFHYGLYEKAQPSCGYWIDIYNQYPSKVPMQTVDKHGFLHPYRSHLHSGTKYKNKCDW